MSITKKLLLINTLICAAFIVVTMVVFFSFRHVRDVLTTTFAAESRRIVGNSNMTRELSRVLSDMNLVLSTFYESDRVLHAGKPQLVRRTEALLAKAGDGELKSSLRRFTRQVKGILAQCERVSADQKDIVKNEDGFDRGLMVLDQMIADRLVDLMAQGEETWDLEQLSNMVGGFRESFMRIRLRFVQLGLEHFRRPVNGQDHPLSLMTDDLLLRLRTLTAAAPDIASHGRRLMGLLGNYKISVSKLHDTAEELGRMLEKNDLEKENLLLMMERIDRGVAKRTKTATASLTALTDRAVTVNLLVFMWILPLVILGGMTAYSIKKPVRKVVGHIERLSKGDIPEEIEEEYKGEFARVRDCLNTLIRATNHVTRLAENIASGSMDIAIRERSPNDRLMQALGRMLHKLREIMEETGGMMRGVGTGRLDIRGNAEAFEGGWRELVAGVNDLVRSLSHAVSRSAALSQEMELARKIQTVLLPEKPRISGYDIAANCKPSEQVGGDYYDVISADGYDWIVIGDVSGHGVAAGLVMMMVQTAIHTVLNENPQVSPSRLLSMINRTIHNNLERMRDSKHMTIIVLAAGKEGRFSFSGLHEDILIWRARSGKTESVDSDGMWIGLEPDISGYLSDDVLRLDPGDILVLHTDGLTEAENPDGKMLDLDGFVKIVERHAHRDPEAMKDRIMADVIRWCEDSRADDMTLVIVKRLGRCDLAD